LEHRSNVLHYLNSGQTRVQSEENATRDEIASRQKDLDKCHQIHADDRKHFDEEEAKKKHEAQIHGRIFQPSLYHDACAADEMDLEAYSSGSGSYLACVHKFVDSEAIEANCHY
jgi:hypothetical protein